MKMRVGSNQIKSEYRAVSVANETLYQLSYTPVLPLKNGSLKSGKNFVSPPLLSTTILLQPKLSGSSANPGVGGTIRGQKKQAFVLVALDVASAEDFKISKAKIFRTSRSGVWPDFRLHIRLWTLSAYHGVDFAKAG
jgi:hypothetical protein